MADNYLTTTIVDHYVGAAVRAELCSETAGAFQTAVFLGLCYGATAKVQTALRNSGYTVPATNTDEYVKLATVGVWMELAYSRPEKHLPYPSNWDTHFARMAAADILSGDAMLNLTVSTTGGIGSGDVSDYSTNVSSTEGSRRHTFSRKNMAGY